MNTFSYNQFSKNIHIYISVIITSFFASIVLAKTSVVLTLVVIVSLGICWLCFVKPTAALYLLALSMLLSPEFGQRTTQGAGVTVRLDDFLLVLICFSWMVRMAINKDDSGFFYKTKLNRPIFYYILACVVSTGLGMAFGNVKPLKGFFFVLKYFEYYVVYFMVVNYVRERRQVKQLIYALLITCFIVDLVGLYQVSSGFRVSAPFEGEEGEPNTFGGYLVIMMAVTISMAIYSQSKKTQFAMWFLTALSFATMLFTRSRSSYLSFACMYLTLLLISRKKILAAILLVVVFSGPYFIPDVVIDRVMYTFKQRKQHGQKQIGNITIDTSTAARLDGWTKGLKAFSKQPIFGYGVTGYPFVDSQYLGVIVYTGIVGLICFSALLWTLFKESWISFNKVNDHLYKALGVAFMAAQVGMMTHALAGNTYIIVRIMEPFWFLAGLVILSPDLEKGTFSKIKPEKTHVTSSSNPRLPGSFSSQNF